MSKYIPAIGDYFIPIENGNILCARSFSLKPVYSIEGYGNTRGGAILCTDVLQDYVEGLDERASLEGETKPNRCFDNFLYNYVKIDQGVCHEAI